MGQALCFVLSILGVNLKKKKNPCAHGVYGLRRKSGIYKTSTNKNAVTTVVSSVNKRLPKERVKETCFSLVREAPLEEVLFVLQSKGWRRLSQRLDGRGLEVWAEERPHYPEAGKS